MCARGRSRRQLLAANQGAGHDAARRLLDFLAARRLRCTRGLRGEDRTAGLWLTERLTKEAQVTAYLGGVHHQQRIRLGASHHKQDSRDSKDSSISGKTTNPPMQQSAAELLW